jgi:hypothetical protein
MASSRAFGQGCGGAELASLACVVSGLRVEVASLPPYFSASSALLLESPEHLQDHSSYHDSENKSYNQQSVEGKFSNAFTAASRGGVWVKLRLDLLLALHGFDAVRAAFGGGGWDYGGNGGAFGDCYGDRGGDRERGCIGKIAIGGKSEEGLCHALIPTQCVTLLPPRAASQAAASSSSNIRISTSTSNSKIIYHSGSSVCDHIYDADTPTPSEVAPGFEATVVQSLCLLARLCERLPWFDRPSAEALQVRIISSLFVRLRWLLLYLVTSLPLPCTRH